MEEIFLVTGGAGFVGSHLLERLLARSVKVRALVRDPSKLAPIKDKIEIVKGDILDPNIVESAMNGISGVYHIAAVFREAKLSDETYFRVNVEGTRLLLDAAVRNGVKRFVYCSTNGVHGDVKNPPANEDAPYAPCDVYQESKVEAEKVVFSYFRESKIRGVIIRPAMIYGPRDTRLLKIFRMINRQKFFYVGKGNALCHFIDVRDLATAFVSAMECTHLNNEAYLIAGEKIIPLNEFCDLVADLLKVKRPWLHIPLVPMQLLGDLCELICRPFGIEPPLYRRRVDFYIKNRSFDISKARRDLNFKVARPFEDEVRSIIEWYQSNGYL